MKKKISSTTSIRRTNRDNLRILCTQQRASRKTRLPWEGKRTDKKTEQFNLRLSECELEKLRFISANTPLSMQSFIRSALTTAIEKKIKTILGDRII
ncbi:MULTISPECIES: hypothetical protein [Candidatus Ichthyocystis]|uniref:hypothetical protein n=1 Tax=Candidatus Ichthyocystis TaxID=2929841 RepID=UPI000B89EA28|nr:MULTISPECIES: hypothetical protein [Ichthyocystis]